MNKANKSLFGSRSKILKKSIQEILDQRFARINLEIDARISPCSVSRSKILKKSRQEILDLGSSDLNTGLFRFIHFFGPIPGSKIC